jgi:hypothetical protein
MKLETHRSMGGRVITLDGGSIASFANDEAGAKAFGIFVTGLGRTPGTSLFDKDANEFLVGDLGQLDSPHA